MRRLIVLAALSVCFAAGMTMTATDVVRQILALTPGELVGLRMAIAEADKVADIDLVLANADKVLRDSFLSLVPRETRLAYEGRMEKIGTADEPAVKRAVQSIQSLLVPPEMDRIRGQALLREGQYREGAAAYERAFKAGAKGTLDYYFAASAWALAGDRDAAFRNLELAVRAGWTDGKMLESDDDLKELRADPRWADFAARLKAERDRRLAALPDSHAVLKTVKLPEPARDGKVSVEAALEARRSIRQYAPGGLSLAEVSQLVWAAYGVNKPVPEVASLGGGLRTAPSAGACYPLEVYVVAGKVDGLEAGIYRYEPATHELRQTLAGDRRAELCEAAANQNGVRTAPASIVYSAVYERNTKRYGDRGRERYVCMDLGHSGENVYLQCAALGLGTCAIGAFFDDDVRQVMRLTKLEEPLYIMPMGRTERKE